MGNITGVIATAVETAQNQAMEVVNNPKEAAKSAGKTVLEQGVGTAMGYKLLTAGAGGLIALGGAPITGASLATLGLSGKLLEKSLPNDPGFDQATANPEALHEQFESTLNNNFEGALPEADEAVVSALEQLNQAFQGSATQTRGDADLANFGIEEFHAALLRGAHFVVSDGGELFQALTETEDSAAGFNARTSSHYNGQDQFGMDLPNGMGHLLVGRTESGDTFFQLEAHGVGNPNQSTMEKVTEVLGHTVSYLQHIGSDTSYVQIGPQGCIAGSEKDGNHVVLN